MATQTEKFLNYNGLLYAFKKIITWTRTWVGSVLPAINTKNTSATADTNDKYIKVTKTTVNGKDTYTVTTTGIGTDISDAAETVKQTAQTGSTALPILTSAQSSPTSGNNYEAGYDTDLKFTPSSNTLTIGTGSLSPTAFSGKATQTETDLASSASDKGASMIGYDATNTAASGTVGGAIKALQDAIGGGDLVKSVDNATSFDPEISKNNEIFTPATGTIATNAKIHGKVVERTGNYTKADNTPGTFTYYDTIYGMAHNFGSAPATMGAGLFRWIEINNQHGIRQNGGPDTFWIVEGVQAISLDGGDIMVDIDDDEGAYYNTTIEQAITSLDANKLPTSATKINNILPIYDSTNDVWNFTLKAGDIKLTSAINTNEYTTNDSIQTVLASLNSKINNATSSGLTRTIVTALPTTNISETTIYMILASNDTNVGDPSTDANQNANAYNEYMYIANAWERIGSTEVNLDIDAMTNSDIDTCWDTALAAA